MKWRVRISRNDGVTDWKEDIDGALADFVTVVALAHSPLHRGEVEVEYLLAPHKPPSRLPIGKMAVYGFSYQGNWLKIGKAGPNSTARYTSQHYNPNSARSTLAASLASDPRMVGLAAFNPAAPGDWIRSATSRVNILLDNKHGTLLLAMLEAFLHLRLRPRYEG